MSVAWVAVGTAAVGALASNVNANKARGSARRANNKSMAFEQEKYDDWQSVYGPIQDNLSDYYSNLTADYYETVGLETFEQERQTALTRLDENLAQRGIDPSSGIAASLQSQAELEGAEGRAAIRRDAPRLAAEDKRSFLQIGLGQNPGGSISQTLANNANNAQQRANQAEQSAGNAVGSFINTAGSALADYANTPASTGGQTASDYTGSAYRNWVGGQ